MGATQETRISLRGKRGISDRTFMLFGKEGRDVARVCILRQTWLFMSH